MHPNLKLGLVTAGLIMGSALILVFILMVMSNQGLSIEQMEYGYTFARTAMVVAIFVALYWYIIKKYK